MGFNISMRCKKGRSLIETPAIHTVSVIRTQYFSICSAMTKKGSVFYKSQNHPFNTVLITLFVEELFAKIEEIGIFNSIFIMDNVAFHKNRTIHEFFAEKNYRMVFLPLYSPFLTPIENIFAQWKEIVRRSNVAYETQLLENIETTFEAINAVNCSGYFINMLRYIVKYQSREVIDTQ